MVALLLAHGRALDIQISSGSGGPPLLWHHGTPGAVTPFSVVQGAAERLGLTLVTWSRPGYGSSARQPGRTVADVAADVTSVLEHVGADRCVTAGWSGGGPHALATAALLPERVAGALSIASIAPYGADDLDFLGGMGVQNIEEFGAALAGEDRLRAVLAAECAALSNAQANDIVGGLATLLPDVDRAVLTADAGRDFGEDLAASFREALRTGIEGWVDDDLAFTRPWGFDLDTLAVPTFVWQGDEDLMVPFAHGQWLSSQISGVTAHLLAGEGHISISVGAMDRMLEELAGTL
ncbi:MAG: alpha/beta hydrolase [Actinomycetota bacterium]|nr:alpha/beta hydrolase [Actinomycetota bacterium]